MLFVRNCEKKGHKWRKFYSSEFDPIMDGWVCDACYLMIDWPSTPPSIFRKTPKDEAYPHCDPWVLHSPGACNYCDLYPDWQLFRLKNQIAFSDWDEARRKKTLFHICPSEIVRDPKLRDSWFGNIPR